MKTRQRSRRMCAMRASALVSGIVASGVSFGSLLPPDDEVPEMMMEMQGTYARFLAYSYGTPSEILSYSSNVNVAARTFIFALASGSTYGGQPAMLSASGAFNSGTNKWDFSASGSIGANNWSSTGTGEDPPILWHFEDDFPLTITTVSDVTYTQTATRTVSEGTFTVKDFLTGAVLSTSMHTDNLILQGDDAGKWMWDDGSFHTPQGDRRVDSSGFTPPGGGVGAFTTAIAVPEPSAMLSLGLFAIAWRRLRANQRAIAANGW